MKLNFKTFRNALIIGGTIFSMVSCKKEPVPVIPEPESESNPVAAQVAYANGSGSHSQILLQGIEDITSGEISFENKGFNMSSARTARIFTSTDGKTIYSLNYRVGTVDKLVHKEGDIYEKIKTFDGSVPLNNGIRFTKINDKLGSVHSISGKAQYADKDKTVYTGHKMVAAIGLLNLETMELKEGEQKALQIKLDESLTKQGYFIWRIDCPILSNGKLYYGTGVSKADPSTGKTLPIHDISLTLVVDVNDLTKVDVVRTNKVKGSTNGYRTPTQHKNEAGEIYQMACWDEGNKGEIYFSKLVNGKYDESFVFNLNKALGGKQTTSNGWFYAGNGIGYVPYQKLDEPKIQIGVNPQGEPSYSADWGLARIDLNKGTAVDLETPKGLWLVQYQSALVRDGIFYMALAPYSGKGNIYSFEVNSTSPQGKKGAEITSGADQYYIGIY